MTTQTKQVSKPVWDTELVSYTCDCCKKVLPADDWIEMQEMLHWRMTGGFGSVFGDCSKISLDLCQICTKNILGDFIQVNDDEAD